MYGFKFGFELGKCHFMVEQGIVLGHIVSSKGIEVDKSKIDLVRSWYKPKCITFISLYLVFCYLLCVNWVNNVEFHDLGVKYGH